MYDPNVGWVDPDLRRDDKEKVPYCVRDDRDFGSDETGITE
jgi:hypothetical protein